MAKAMSEALFVFCCFPARPMLFFPDNNVVFTRKIFQQIYAD